MIRRATSDDLDAIMAIENASFPTDAWSTETMTAELAGEYSHYLVDEQDGLVVGYAGLRSVRGASDADIQTIALLETHRGAGRGRALLAALLAEAASRGNREVFLEVRADNPGAEGLYLSEGFTELGRRPRYYQPDGVDAIVMRLDLGAQHARQPNGRTSREPEDPNGPIAPSDRAASSGSGDTQAAKESTA
ncbi:ribosomal protein S18-alanine N-acetyltransferase [Microbacterium sp. NPDC056234]|uniref:ribosomal protein S18-alanine N-acetyltransferase n=1 Tax=Microbacterium sp. NPDC056234 TaxID=3345757 RepID=UPI0035D89917